ncbi:hypothetical protein CYMTET_30122, partial [Cymbomonas tetramitiformis]
YTVEDAAEEEEVDEEGDKGGDEEEDARAGLGSAVVWKGEKMAPRLALMDKAWEDVSEVTDYAMQAERGEQEAEAQGPQHGQFGRSSLGAGEYGGVSFGGAGVGGGAGPHLGSVQAGGVGMQADALGQEWTDALRGEANGDGGEASGADGQLGESSRGSSQAERLATNLLDSIQDILRGERPARGQRVDEEEGGGQEGPTGLASEVVTQDICTRGSQGDGDLVGGSVASQGASTHILSVDDILGEVDDPSSPGSQREFVTQE